MSAAMSPANWRRSCVPPWVTTISGWKETYCVSFQPRRSLSEVCARGLLGFKREALMAFFTYLDASGDANDPAVRVVSTGGLLGHEHQWGQFEDEWRLLLDRFGVSMLHMKDINHFRREFATWKQEPQKRADFF